MKIFICRHGETTGDIEDRYGGDYDDHLTDHGKKEAQELAQKLVGKNIEKIFCSPKIRAQETASIVNQKLNLTIEIVNDFRERNQYGILTGMVKSEAKQKFPELAENLKNYQNTIEGAESYEDFDKRIYAALEQISEKDFSTVAIISHGGPIKAIMRRIEFHEDFKIADCGYIEIEMVDGKINLISSDGIEAKN